MLLFLFACFEGDTETNTTLEIPTEAYDWDCIDYQDHSEINIIAGVCNEFESLTVSVSFINENYIEHQMYHEGGCWWNGSISQEEKCIEIEQLFIIGEANGW